MKEKYRYVKKQALHPTIKKRINAQRRRIAFIDYILPECHGESCSINPSMAKNPHVYLKTLGSVFHVSYR